ncbi:D-alanyl-D-alanine carboxypeptidase/D-alanyl-D-alanine endopeptidase [Actinomarinicola tropica]|uniref:D-alanyl-D-alanine carboxypeptidase/D-alanyl-D-alanine-endopeptidase n=1 Tax=Actinomarinicola tropica TaxID=2789776 RepID=A0A5Q2RL57_9ACTN|nr:D-alanyl-D-alanine carboxypeptidase/D-alanyl-D-alanine-endopeptidase [Actinomarinicola tropica]QGG95311.1 D-alanyl-D-alanine carboxypeptidase/D-alanyl-D-alanine-endopeptidase [Actinomarinicola tropica]
MRFLAVVVVLAALAAGAGWAALEVDASTGTESSVGTQAVTPVLSVRRAPESLLDVRRDQAAAAAVADVPGRIPGGGCLVVAQGGRELVLHDPDRPLVPASTQKLLVAGALLSLMEPDETFRTTAVATGPVTDGVVEGDLVVVGGGDPLLSTDAYIARQSDPARPATRIEDLADAVVAAGITEVRGAVVGDGTRYDDVRTIPSWPQRYRDQVVAGPLSGLGVNDGLETFTDTEVPVNPGRPAADPPAHTAAVMTDLLRERGVTVVGDPRSGSAPQGATEVAALESPPVRDVVAQMLVYSDNTTAELLVKEIGVRSGVGGSTAAGLAALRDLLAGQGIPVEGLALTDGSGLDLGNRATCRTLAAVLDRSPSRDVLIEGLAVAGESGTLAERMVGTPAAGNLRAKTGSLRHVAALAGVVDGPDGRRYTFAYITNVPEGEFVPELGSALQEEIAVALATVPEVEPPPEVMPEPLAS